MDVATAPQLQHDFVIFGSNGLDRYRAAGLEKDKLGIGGRRSRYQQQERAQDESPPHRSAIVSAI
jgi:hypothetical protein